VTDPTACGRPYALVRELARCGVTLWSLPPARLRAIVTREAARLDRGFATERATRARSERRVDLEDHPDFCSSLYVRTGTDHASAAYRNVDDAARAARRAGDSRSLDQLRADIAVGWLTEGAYGTLVVRCEGAAVDRSDDLVLPRPDRPLVHVTLPQPRCSGWTRSLGSCTVHAGRCRSRPGSPASWPGVGARSGAGCCTTRPQEWRPTCHPRIDPGPGWPRFVRARDGEQTRFPTSGATRLELDHVGAYCHARPETGGQTRADNLVAAGKRDHQLKTDRLVTVSGDANSPLTYVTPSGRRYVSHPYAYAEPLGRSRAPTD
jgi:hypothetical protein